MQALVENAIKHGIAPLKQDGTLRIAAHVVASHRTARRYRLFRFLPAPLSGGVGDSALAMSVIWMQVSRST